MSTWTDKEPYPANFVPALLADTWKSHLAKEKPVEMGRDRFPIFAGNPRRAEHILIANFIDETWDILDLKLAPKDYASGRAILDFDDARKVRTILAICERLPWFWKTGVSKHNEGPFGIMGVSYHYEEPIWRLNLGFLLNWLVRTPPPFSTEDFRHLLRALNEPPDRELLFLIEAKHLVRIVEVSWPNGGIPEPVVERLQEIETYLSKHYFRNRAEDRKVMDQLGALLRTKPPEFVKPGEAWSDACLADLKSMSGAECQQWLGLLAHCQLADGSKPTKKWLSGAAQLVEEIGRGEFKPRALRWLELVALPRTVRVEIDPRSELRDPNQVIDEKNATALRGLVWYFAGWTDPEISSALSTLAEVCFKKVRWLGPRCPRVGNACLYSLSSTSSEDAAAQLSRLDSTVKQPTAKKRIGKSLDAAATLTGQTREDLEEKSVPTFDLNLEGILTRNFGDYSARLQVVRSRDVEITWSRSDGKSFKAVPVEVKRDHATGFKQFQKLAKDIEKMLTAQRIRIERLLMTEREWNFDSWRQRYLDHPLLAGISRRLIWHFKLGDRTTLGAVLNGKIVDISGQVLDWLAPETRVRIWHPIGFPIETVAAWREWLQTHEICQPFKQAHREIYILTDAELQTATYSNRFAAHILGQHQFAALCTQRGWKYSFMGGFDFQATPMLPLPAWNMCAEFWVEPAGELAASGVSLYLTTDQVRFVRDDQALPLTEISAIVFSEVMRDVDLFVGVGSIGNDPAWQDQGELEGGGEYWRAYSFGHLNDSAKTRREVLEKLLPKLKIADRCFIDEKFLTVRGDLRTYKIHLGSANIQLEPNAQYLCIVPERGAAASKTADGFFLPFEGDRTLSIILSKAFLLAADKKIKDPSILSQIKR